MKNKIISLLIIYSFFGGIMSAPVSLMARTYFNDKVLFQETEVKNAQKDMIFLADNIAPFDVFTQNIKKREKKTFDFSFPERLYDGAFKDKFKLEESYNKLGFSALFRLFSYNVDERQRLRTPINVNDYVIFVCFILLYIGMLKSIHLNKKDIAIFYERPLFA